MVNIALLKPGIPGCVIFNSILTPFTNCDIIPAVIGVPTIIQVERFLPPSFASTNLISISYVSGLLVSCNSVFPYIHQSFQALGNQHHSSIEL